MRDKKNKKGFTLAELLVALMISAIVLAAVATLAWAMSSANESSGDTAQQQAQLRYATFRISELIRNCRMICNRDTDNMGIWRADDNGNGLIDAEESVFVEKNALGNQIQLFECIENMSATPALFGISDFISGTARSIMEISPQLRTRQTVLVRQCSNIEFKTDVEPPYSKFASIRFKMMENNIAHKYQIDASLRAWAGHLIESVSGTYHIVGSDDDE